MTTTAVSTPDPDDEGGTPDDEGGTPGVEQMDPARQRIFERRTKVMFLRNAGATWTEIAAQLGVHYSTVQKDYAVVCRDLNNENPATVVARHRAVIFDIQRANYSAMMKGDKDAAATILKALDREARLLGLDAPTRIMAAVNDVDFANEAARLIERIARLSNPAASPPDPREITSGTIIDAELEAAPDVAGDHGTAQPEPGSRGEGRPTDSPHGPFPGNAGGGRLGTGFDDGDGWSNI